MGVLFIKNYRTEGPGTLAEYLGTSSGFAVAEPEDVPAIESLAPYGSVIVLGGPMGVYEMDEYPHIRKTASLIEKAVKEDKRVLGVCLGAQLLAHVLGAKVYKGQAGPEVGWFPVDITPEGMKDPVMGNIADAGKTSGTVFQFHGDTFDLPGGAVHLASSAMYPNQAFRYKKAYALQFHIECTREMIAGWLGGRADLPVILAETDRQAANYRARADKAYERFFSL